MGRNGNAQYFCVSYSNIAHFTDQNWISKTVICNRCVMVGKNGFANWNTKVALLRASMVVTYYIKLFWTETDRQNGIAISLLRLVAETIKLYFDFMSLSCHLLVSEWIYTLWFAWMSRNSLLEVGAIKWQQRDSNPQPLRS